MESLETQIVNVAKNAINESIFKCLTSPYDSPLNKIVKNVIDKHRVEFEKLFDNEICGLIDGSGFKNILKEALNKKLASVLVGKIGGELEKRVSELKQNPTTRAKITLALNKIIEKNI